MEFSKDFQIDFTITKNVTQYRKTRRRDPLSFENLFLKVETREKPKGGIKRFPKKLHSVKKTIWDPLSSWLGIEDTES